jgi:hypothetical protein
MNKGRNFCELLTILMFCMKFDWRGDFFGEFVSSKNLVLKLSGEENLTTKCTK